MSSDPFGEARAKPLTTRWWWVRHAPVVDHGGRIYGQEDMTADTSDTLSFAGLAKILPDEALWVHSSLKRTIHTGEAIFAARGLNPAADMQIEPAFMEQSFGDWQGRNRHEFRAKMGRPHPLWLCPAHMRPPNGESFIDLMARVGAALERWTEAHPGRDIVALAHGGTIRAVLAHVMGIEPEKALRFQIDNLSVTEVTFFHESSPGTPSAEGSTPGMTPHWTVGGVNMPPALELRFDQPQA